MLSEAQRYAELAVQADNSGDPEEATEHYIRAASRMAEMIRAEPNREVKSQMRIRMEEYIGRAEKLKKLTDPQFVPGHYSPRPNRAGSYIRNGGNGSSADSETEKMRGALSGVVVTEKPDVTWDDVIGMEDAKQALNEAVLLPMRAPQLFTGARKPWSGVLLYGPPGTGKSHLAKAVANASNSTFFNVSSTDIVSKWQGDSEKLISNLFAMARESAPAIVFIDEVDSIARKRHDDEQESTRRIKTEMLRQMDGMKSEGQVLVLGATNTPWDIDTAFMRRFQKRIHIGLPEFNDRMRIVNLHLKDTPHTMDVEDFARIAEMTEGFSGSDLRDVVTDAVMQPIRNIKEEVHVKRRGAPPEEFFEICSPETEGAVLMTVKDLDMTKLRGGHVTMQDFENTVRKTRPSVPPGDLHRFIQWDAEAQKN